ncbi:ABC transporter permease family protein [Paenibacillus psychroresistens]|uniref:hypothetical protein n=1 Tax=Paenibacillus psychroresistens TaxID=1778678 RepID=UPI001D049907|nr:hypothetical protein [Paenibacillus psychroresistens]
MIIRRQTTPQEEIWIHLLFILVSIAILIPFLLVVSISLTKEQSLLDNGYQIIPHVFSLDAYKYILQSPIILLRAYGVTIFVTIIGTIANLLITAMAAYAISRRDYAFRQLTTFYFFFTMLFGGDLFRFIF